VLFTTMIPFEALLLLMAPRLITRGTGDLHSNGSSHPLAFALYLHGFHSVVPIA